MMNSIVLLILIANTLTTLYAGQYNVKDYGAVGDGKVIDSPAINKAIDAAAEAGGGTVYFPAGTYLSFTIRLKSNIGLYLDHGAVILAASHKEHDGGYDLGTLLDGTFQKTQSEAPDHGGVTGRINISDVIVHNANPESASLIVGIPGHNIEDVKLNNIQFLVTGGATKEYTTIDVPELEDHYPDPLFFGKIPAYGFFIRHVDGIEFNNVEICYVNDDLRPAFVLDDVQNAKFNNVNTRKMKDIPMFMLKNVKNFEAYQCEAVDNTKLGEVGEKNL